MAEDELKTCKVVLLGESGVGKTCIISRYINNNFDEQVMSTNGASYAGKTMLFEEFDQTIRFEIWDTAGQEKYRSLTKIFYKDASVAILVYDITSKDSYDEIKNYWYEQVKESAPTDIVVGIAANKSDLIDREVIPEEEARKYAQSIGAIFMSTSALNASGVDELFKQVGLKFLKKDLPQENIPAGTTGGNTPVIPLKKTEKTENTIRLDGNTVKKGDDNKKVKKKCC